jgi:hypothetical protein
MRVRRIVAGVVGVTVMGLLVVLMLATSTGPRPPVLTLVRVEPAGIIDDSGAEMWLMTLSVSNSDNRPPRPENRLYVGEGDGPIEVKIGSRWIGLHGTLGRLGDCELAPAQKCERLLLTPGGTESCRISLKYTGASALKGLVEWVATRLPLSIRSRFSYKFWRWVGSHHMGRAQIGGRLAWKYPVSRQSNLADSSQRG